jgi:hypothetical protein
MDVRKITVSGSSYRLEDPGKNWKTEQWAGKKIVFPSGLIMNIYHSGSNWVDLWKPAEVPNVGAYAIGDYSYQVYKREFEKALVLFRPFGASKKSDDSTAVVETLPVTPANPQGHYFLLNRDGTLSPTPVTTVTLRNTEGAILVHPAGLKPPPRPRVVP